MDVTFGIAVYNVEKYIAACIESILVLKGDFEILIVNDGSKDSSGKICDEYAARDKRIRVHHRENRGVSCARNYIIENARGKWLTFIDGDDRISSLAAEYIEEYASDDFDCIYFDMHRFVFDDKISRYTVKAPPQTVEGDMLLELTLSTLYSARGSESFINQNLRSVCGKLFKTQLLRNNCLRQKEELRYAQDVMYNLECLPYYKRVLLVRVPFYLYRQNPASTVRRYNPKIDKLADILITRITEYVQNSPLRTQLLERFYLRCVADMNSTLKQSFCHIDNPQPFEKRKAGCTEFINRQWCRQAIKTVNPNLLTDNDFRAFSVFKNGDFVQTDKYYKAKFRKEKLKVFINKTGLNKLFRPLRDALKH